ncbi:MAG: AAA family ATPase [Bacteroidales bacterium]|nr:AAA family ATPase [Bacteroidales bacterium]
MDWKNRPDHKPLILQGARQVGKTYILEEFGRNHYKNYYSPFFRGYYFFLSSCFR